MEIHKLVCDNCGKEKDLLDTYVEHINSTGEHHWQKLNLDGPMGMTTDVKDFCCPDCMSEWWEKNKK